MFIKLTEHSNSNIIYLKVKNIKYFSPKIISNNGNPLNFTHINLKSNLWFNVNQTPEEILNLIKKEKNV